MSAASMIQRDMEESSVRVREAAEEQVEQQQTDLTFSRPVLVFSLVFNSIVLIIVISFLVVSRDEQSVRLRLWLIFHQGSYLVGVLLYSMEYIRRRNLADWVPTFNCVLKLVGYVNSFFSFIWFAIGISLVSFGGSKLAKGSPHLHRICVGFLIYDGVIVAFFSLWTCLIGIAITLFLPRIIEVLHAVAPQERATEEDIEQLPKFIYKDETIDRDNPEGSSIRNDKIVCAICLSKYKDESELRQLPCSHHFHSKCVDKWLFIKATCPLCNCSILKSEEQTDHV